MISYLYVCLFVYNKVRWHVKGAAQPDLVKQNKLLWYFTKAILLICGQKVKSKSVQTLCNLQRQIKIIVGKEI